MPTYKPSFAAFTKRYSKYRETKVRYASKKQVDAIVNTHLSDMKERPVNEVFTRSNLSRWRTGLYHKRDLSIGYRNRMISCLLSMAKQAFCWKYITSAAYREATAVLEPLGNQPSPKKERPIYTKSQIQSFLDVIDDEEEKLMFELFAYLGCRIGEFIGLTWDCLHKDGSIEIKQQCTYEGKGKWVLTPLLKTSESYRVCPLPPRLANELEKRRVRGHGYRFLFSMRENHRTPYGESTFRSRMDRYTAKAGLPRLTPHCFRHSKATMLLEVCNNMEEVKSAARFLGHSATMLLDTYGHAKENTLNEILARLDG